MLEEIYIGKQKGRFSNQQSGGEYCQIGDETYYKLSNVDQMRPFFMSIVSAEDHWLFISSNRGITAGRINSDNALFPYVTDDKLIDSVETSGGKTIFLVEKDKKFQLWEPFSERYSGIYSIERNLYKNRMSSKIIFQEVNRDLGLSFYEQWSFSSQFGIVKSSTIEHVSKRTIKVELIDGIQNIIPANVTEQLQSIRSNLVDAYKKSELLDNRLGIYSLSSQIVDRAIPSESLEATIAWSAGLQANNILLSSSQLENFRKGIAPEHETDMRAEKGAFFINSRLILEPGSKSTWHIIADVGNTVADIKKVQKLINSSTHVASILEREIEQNSQKLLIKLAKADGIQFAQDDLVTSRHLSNVLFNIMRGGIFDKNYTIERDYFIEMVRTSNLTVYNKNKELLESFPDSLSSRLLKDRAEYHRDPDLLRLAYEYLPLNFSRRHGDPSRPWNKFHINTYDESGDERLYYEGNWRDIFQNWEALAISFPYFLENMIVKFINASTIDGYNPYRISTNGIDWEVVEPDNPWSYIGYWGDHQLIYLLRLLELQLKIDPERLYDLMGTPLAVYANVPYRIKSFKEILKNPQDTILFDDALAEEINDQVKKLGSDGKLVIGVQGELLRANLAEKLLVSVLTKVANFVPDAGIWMNTQRPEWNDANNALVGNGCSMVTLYQLRRYLVFLVEFLESTAVSYEINEPVIDLFNNLQQIFEKYSTLSSRPATPKERFDFVSEVGNTSEAYRKKAYSFFENSKIGQLEAGSIRDFCQLLLPVLDQTIHLNKREDGLYHSYNTITFEDCSVLIGRLELMLEGQVNILGSGYIDTIESIDLLKSLRNSSLYHPDQNSYLLYPDKERPLFINRNNINYELIKESKLVDKMITNNFNWIIETDDEGGYHFNSNLHNSEELCSALKELRSYSEYKKLVDQEETILLKAYEAVFNHRQFTGRSGTFYGYEGLGSIYWHMVSKLVLAVAELVQKSIEEDDGAISDQLVSYYHAIKEGIGTHKAPNIYGGIPTDPYSHTPGNKGGQQPGMTGQVKEDILSRFKELGVNIRNGRIEFNNEFVAQEEYLKSKKQMSYLNLANEWQTKEVQPNSLAFTLCQVPIIFNKARKNGILVVYSDGRREELAGPNLTADVSSSLFGRSGKIDCIEVSKS